MVSPNSSVPRAPGQLGRYVSTMSHDEKNKQFQDGVVRLPEHESGVRRVVSDSQGIEYRALHSLQEAKSFADGVVILEGDDGGQIYIVCPASLIQCSEETLTQLLKDLDRIAWPSNDAEMARVFYERQKIGAGIAGGMGGAIVEESVWVHSEFQERGFSTAIREVLTGKRLRIRSDT